MHAQSLQSCPALRDPMGCSPPGFSVHGILQARKLEWVAISFSRGLPNSGIKPASPTLQAESLPLSHWVSTCSIFTFLSEEAWDWLRLTHMPWLPRGGERKTSPRFNLQLVSMRPRGSVGWHTKGGLCRLKKGLEFGSPTNKSKCSL